MCILRSIKHLRLAKLADFFQNIYLRVTTVTINFWPHKLKGIAHRLYEIILKLENKLKQN